MAPPIMADPTEPAVTVETDDSDEDALLITRVRPAAAQAEREPRREWEAEAEREALVAIAAAAAGSAAGGVADEACAAAEMLFPLVEAAVWEAHAELMREHALVAGATGVRTSGPAPTCAQCDCPEAAAVTARCSECGSLCEACAAAHSRMKCLRHHAVSPLPSEAAAPVGGSGTRLAAQPSLSTEESGRGERGQRWHWRWSESVPVSPQTAGSQPPQPPLRPDGAQEPAPEKVCSMGAADLCRPRCVAVGADRLVYVCDGNENGKVRVFQGGAGGDLVRSIGGDVGSGEGLLDCPMGVAVDDRHDRVYVSDYTSHRVQVFRASDATFVASLGNGAGSGPGQLKHPCGLAIHYDVHGRGLLHVADTGNNRVSIFPCCVGSSGAGE